MFFSMGHGQRVISAGTGHPGGPAPVQTFGYLFETAAEFPEFDDIKNRFERLAEAMQEAVPETEALSGRLPPIFTYLGQFIDHDISVNTDSDNEASKIDDDPLLRQPRGLIVANVMNGRNGTLGLDSLYGDKPRATPADLALQAAMRDGPFLREGRTAPFGVRPELPRSGGDDLPRVGPLVADDILDIDLLDEEARPNPDDPADPRHSRAFIGDGRNDENLIVAQLHLAFIRFHNAVARKIISDGGPMMDDATVFAVARRITTWTYQWIVVNEFLPAICRPQDVASVIAGGAPLYTAFLKRLSEVDLGGQLPLPLEFSVAAYRFGHTMVRQNYDFNRNFGRPGFEMDGSKRASLTELFQFTGRGPRGDGPGDPAGPFGPAPGPVLPHNWVIEWNRLVESRPLFADRLARPIDTHLAPDLFNMLKEEAGVFKNLAVRNLRRGYNMNLPTGQAALQTLRERGAALGPVLTKARLTAGTTGRALRNAGLDDATPLWFYILKEAEEMEGGARLGTVGSHIVADTIIGLIIHDRDSYWHVLGSGADGRWSPRDGVMPTGRPVMNINALLEAAGVLETAATPPFGTFAAFSGAAPMLASAAAAPPTKFPRATVERDVLETYHHAFSRWDPNYQRMKPSDFYPTLRGWQNAYQNDVNAPLVTKYSDWNGLTQADTADLYDKTFTWGYGITTASLLSALRAKGRLEE